MNIVIDANIFAGYFKCYVLGIDSDLTEDPSKIFEHLGSELFNHMDEGKQIESEWSSVVEREWFDAWFPEMIIEGKIRFIDVSTHHQTIRKLKAIGLPCSRDVWYIRTALELAKHTGEATIISEDIDFYDPKKKSDTSKKRLKIISNSSGNVAKFLCKKEKVKVLCVSSFYE